MPFLRRLATIAKDSWLIVGISLVIFIFMEMAFSLAFYIKDSKRPALSDFRATADTYADPAWAAKYYQEIYEIEHKQSIRWKSYVYWRRMSRQGEYINIGSDGLRKTYNVANATDSKPPKKVFMFGGSTIWGLGAADDFTIPSIFAKEASEEGISCEVVNYGQYAYVSTQGVIELMLQLQKGNIPDAVIFYDGVNDTFGAFQLGLSGLPHGEFARDQEFTLLERTELRTQAIQAEIKKLSMTRFLSGALKKFNLQVDSFQPNLLEFEKPITDKKALAQSVVETYLNNIQVVQALAKAYGFKCLFYWQPMIFLKKNLTEYERRSIELDFNFPGMKEFYLDTYSAMQQRAAGLKADCAFYDISSIFNDLREPIYIDFNHMGERGNSRIAKRMAEDFAQLIEMKEQAGCKWQDS